MLYVLYDENKISRNVVLDVQRGAVGLLDKQNISALIAAAPLATLHIILNTPRLRTAVLKIAERHADAIETSGRKLLPILEVGVAQCSYETREDARTIGEALSYLADSKDAEILKEFVQLFSWLRSARGTARARGRKVVPAGKSLDETYRFNLGKYLPFTSLVEIKELLQAMYSGTSITRRDTVNEQFYALVGFVGVLIYFAEFVDALDGVVLMLTPTMIQSFDEHTVNLFRSELDTYQNEYLKIKSTNVQPQPLKLPWEINKSSRYVAVLDQGDCKPVTKLFVGALQRQVQAMGGINFSQLITEEIGSDLVHNAEQLGNGLLQSPEAQSMTDEEKENLVSTTFQMSVILGMLDRHIRSQEQSIATRQAKLESTQHARVEELQAALSNKDKELTSLRQDSEQGRERLEHRLEVVNDALAQFDRTKLELEDARDEIEFIKQSQEAAKVELDVEQAPDEAFDPDEVIERFNQSDVVFVGGDVKWSQKLNEVLTDAQFFDKDALGRSVAPFKNAAVVVMNVAKMSHSMSGKVRRTLAPDTELFYLNEDQSNIEMTLRILAVVRNKN